MGSADDLVQGYPRTGLERPGWRAQERSSETRAAEDARFGQACQYADCKDGAMTCKAAGQRPRKPASGRKAPPDTEGIAT
jgi:hypothetical protein